MALETFVLNSLEFIGNMNFSIFSAFIGMVLVIFWLVLIGWVWIDSGERTSKASVRFVYLLLVFFLNIPGLIIYLIIRPSETIEEIYWADLERRYLKYETSDLGDCPKCGHQLYPGFAFCSNCGNEIKRKCIKCGVLINKDHKFCESCGTQLRDRAIVQELYPDVSVMERQILETKEHATQTVESKRTKYKTGKSFVVKLGEIILSIWKSLTTVKENTLEKVNNESKDEKKEEKSSTKQRKVTAFGKKKKSKKKKRK